MRHEARRIATAAWVAYTTLLVFALVVANTPTVTGTEPWQLLVGYAVAGTFVVGGLVVSYLHLLSDRGPEGG